MGSAVKMRADYSADELRRLAKVLQDVNQSRRLGSEAGAILNRTGFAGGLNS